jgi:Rrf2 family protein
MLTPPVCYATKALAHVVTAGEQTVSVRDIARATGIPAAYLAKIVNQLARKGIVSTQRGVGGGVTSAPGRALERVTLHELCKALDDPVVEDRCLIGQTECSDERACPAHAFWSPQRRRLARFLQKTTLGAVAAFEAARGAPNRSRR